MKLNFRLPRLPKLPKLSEIHLPSLPLDLRKIESFDREHYRIMAYGFGAVILLMIVAGVSAFLISLRGQEQTMVPDVRGMELSQALVKMQDKELYPRLTLRFTDNPLDRGNIVDQSPAPGTIVKAGRRIALTVSRGAVTDKVENFVGEELNTATVHIQTMFAGQRPLLTIKDTIYIFDKAPVNTILEQKPTAGTPLSGPTDLQLVVSRGPEKAQIKVPDLMGLGWSDVVAQLPTDQVVVDFTMRAAAKAERAGVVVSESPAAGSMVQAGSRVAVTLTAPSVTAGNVAGVFSRSLPAYPVPLTVSLEWIAPSGDITTLLTLSHPGGSFTAPYLLAEGSVLVLKVEGREVPPRETVVASQPKAP